MSNNLIPSTSAGGFSTVGNIAGNVFIGNGSQLTSVTGNIAFSDTTIYVPANVSSQFINISYNGEGYSYFQLPSDDTANSTNALLNNQIGNVTIGTGRAGLGTQSWMFGNDGILTVPGEGIIQSNNDTVILQSVNESGNVYSARLGTTGGLYFATTEYPGGWLDITNNSGNASIASPINSGGAAGHNLNLTAGAADNGVLNTNVGGNLNLTGGTGGFNDDGIGGAGGDVNIIGGAPGEPGNVSGNLNITTSNVNISTGTAAWAFDNLGYFRGANLSILSGNGLATVASIIEDNGSLNVLANGTGGTTQVGWLSNTYSGLGDTAAMVFNEVGNTGNAVIRTGNTAADSFAWIFDNTGNLNAPGNISLNGGYITGGVANIVTDGINSIALAPGAAMDVYGFPFVAGPARGQLTITNVTTPSEANGTWYYQSFNNSYTYQIYTDSTYTTLVDATGWSAYTGGGSVAITLQSPPANIVINSNGYLSTFANNGAVNLSGALTIAGGITTDGNMYVGPAESANATAFPQALAVISSTAANIQVSEPGPTGLVAEATGNPADTANRAVGIYGVGYTSGGTGADGVSGEAHVSDSTDTGTATAVRGYADSTHSGTNIGLYSSAIGGDINYALYMKHGNIFSFDPQAWTVVANTANALTIGSATSANLLVVNTAANVIAMSGNLSVAGNITGNTAGYAIGYRDIPQVTFSGNTTIDTTNAGKHFYSTQSSNFTLTIANNASQGFQVGSAITVVNQGTGVITVAQGLGVTLYIAGNATSGNRSIATFGMATIMKVATDTWFINGTGVS